MDKEQSTEELKALLAQIAFGDRLAFQMLYKKTSANLFGVLLRMLKDRSLAEDALQETYVQVWNNARAYREGSGAPMTWLNSLARYRAIDLMRKRRNDRLHSPIQGEVGAEDPALVYFDKLPDHSSHTLKKCLSGLDELQSKAIILSYCEGYSHQELSSLLSSPLGSVKSWIRRGLAALRECLER